MHIILTTDKRTSKKYIIYKPYMYDKITTNGICAVNVIYCKMFQPQYTLFLGCLLQCNSEHYTHKSYFS